MPHSNYRKHCEKKLWFTRAYCKFIAELISELHLPFIWPSTSQRMRISSHANWKDVVLLKSEKMLIAGTWSYIIPQHIFPKLCLWAFLIERITTIHIPLLVTLISFKCFSPCHSSTPISSMVWLTMGIAALFFKGNHFCTWKKSPSSRGHVTQTISRLISTIDFYVHAAYQGSIPETYQSTLSSRNGWLKPYTTNQHMLDCTNGVH